MKLEPSLETLQAQVELRVLVGPQAGSCLNLSIGDYSLGTSDDCEIILIGPRLEPVHARLSFDGDQISIMPIDGRVCDAQGNEIADAFPLTLGMPVDLGGIWISVDSVDAAWPDPADVLPLPAPPVTPSSPALEVNETASKTVTSGDSLRKRAKITLLISVLSLLTLMLAGIFTVGWLLEQKAQPTAPAFATKPNVPPIPPQQQKINQIIKNLDLAKAVEIKVSDKGGVTVAGYLPDAAIKSQLVQALKNVTPAPTLAIYVDSELLEAAKRVVADKLDPSRIKLHAESVNLGTLKVHGAAQMQSARDNAFDVLKTEVPGLRQIEGSILQSDDLPQQFQERISSAGLTKKLQIVSRQPEFVLRGVMNEDDLRNWESILMAFHNDYGQILPIRATIKLIEKKLPVNVQIIVGGTMPFVITEGGQRVTRGGDVSGHTLITVKDTEVIFDGNEKVKISR